MPFFAPISSRILRRPHAANRPQPRLHFDRPRFIEIDSPNPGRDNRRPRRRPDAARPALFTPCCRPSLCLQPRSAKQMHRRLYPDNSTPQSNATGLAAAITRRVHGVFRHLIRCGCPGQFQHAPRSDVAKCRKTLASVAVSVSLKKRLRERPPFHRLRRQPHRAGKHAPHQLCASLDATWSNCHVARIDSSRYEIVPFSRRASCPGMSRHDRLCASAKPNVTSGLKEFRITLDGRGFTPNFSHKSANLRPPADCSSSKCDETHAWSKTPARPPASYAPPPPTSSRPWSS